MEQDQGFGVRVQLSGLAGLLLLGCVLAPRNSAIAAPGPVPTPAFAALRKAIVVRLLNGMPVPGITVELHPAPLDMGGPLTPMLSQAAITDTQGQAIFLGLNRWIWLAVFEGTFEGRTLQATSAQGHAPYGTSRSGGFVVRLEAQEEGAPPTPRASGLAADLWDQASCFVLLSNRDTWVPTLDLAGPDVAPQPLALLPVAPSTDSCGVTATNSSPITSSPLLDVETLLAWGLGLGGGALLLWTGMRHQHRREQHANTEKRGAEE